MHPSYPPISAHRGARVPGRTTIDTPKGVVPWTSRTSTTRGWGRATNGSPSPCARHRRSAQPTRIPGANGGHARRPDRGDLPSPSSPPVRIDQCISTRANRFENCELVGESSQSVQLSMSHTPRYLRYDPLAQWARPAAPCPPSTPPLVLMHGETWLAVTSARDRSPHGALERAGLGAPSGSGSA